MEKEVSTLSKVFSPAAPRPVVMVLGGTKWMTLLMLPSCACKQDRGPGHCNRCRCECLFNRRRLQYRKPSTQLIAQLKYQQEIEKAKEILTLYRTGSSCPIQLPCGQDNRRVEYPVDKIPRGSSGARSRDGCQYCPLRPDPEKNQEPSSSTDLQEYLRMLTLQRGRMNYSKAASKVEFSVVGGGHTAAVIEKMGLEHDFTHISTGGGACIEFLTGEKITCR